MNLKKFRTLSIVLATSMLVGLIPAISTAATASVKVVKDGSTLTFDEQPQIINGRTFVPYRKLAEEIGAKVNWNENTKQVTMTKGSKTAVLTINSNTAKLNGKNVSLDAAPIVKNERTLVPLRFVSESLGLWVKWNASSKTVNVESSKTVKHAMGTTTLKSVPERVVVLYQGMTDITLTLGVKPVGAVESWLEKPFYHYIRSELNGVKNLGEEGQPNLEAIVALKPDLILGSKLRDEKIYNQLSKIAPTIMTESVFDWKSHLKLAGDVLNKDQQANEFLSDWDARVAEFKKEMGSDRLKNTEVSLIRFQPGNTARVYVTGFAGTIMAELGLSRPEAQQSDQVVINLSSKEQIPLLDGDIIFDFTSDWNFDGEAYQVAKDWKEHALWKNLDGVKDGKYYVVNDVTWNMAGGARAAKMMLDDLFFYFDLE